ncbi:NYN domain-containing protein [Alicyclobacillus herbarius]|uniref:NYN domain-containing protein n=1 Tax=Alicyclobacillus herbarius TaxID=122960 RepID=UPI0003FA6814|nr:NYN domain-containing protein [Alicyclobacillus herbarius]
MKSSGSAKGKARGGRHSACLIVDGYNILARQAERRLTAIPHLEAKRDDLVAALSEYGAFSGQQVIVVFDAGRTPEKEADEQRRWVRIIYTAPGETADGRIERLVYELKDKFHQITVATSDAAEQQVAFGGGALRISAGELIRRLQDARSRIERATGQMQSTQPRLHEALSSEVAKKLEDWRRQ